MCEGGISLTINILPSSGGSRFSRDRFICSHRDRDAERVEELRALLKAYEAALRGQGRRPTSARPRMASI
jgi:hypothetical protein